MEPKDWEDDFREVWSADYPTVEDAARAFAAFISNLLLEQKKKAIEALPEGKYSEIVGVSSEKDEGWNMYRAEALKRVEETL